MTTLPRPGNDDGVRGHINGWGMNSEEAFVTLRITVPSAHLGKFADKKSVTLTQATEKESAIMPDQTPVTDDDREAHDWADTVGNQKGWSDRIHAVVRAIRAHVPAPPATLADELRTRAHACIGPDGNPIFGGDETLLVLADRVEAVEKELNEARALLATRVDASRLDEARAEVEQWQSNTGQANLDLAKAQRERDDAREKLADKLDEVAQLHAEVERLSRDREDQEKALTEHGRLLSEARANEASDSMQQQAKAWSYIIEHPVFDGALGQGPGNGLENALHRLDSVRAEVERLTAVEAEYDRLYGVCDEDHYPVTFTPDPPTPSTSRALPDTADVPESEPYLVTFEGGQWIGLRNDPADEDEPWHLTHLTRTFDEWVSDKEVELVARLVRETRRVIDRPEALDALPVGSVVADGIGRAAIRFFPNGSFHRSDGLVLTASQCFGHGPVTVVYVPEVTA